jgi:PAS domain S-box-containing protein
MVQRIDSSATMNDHRRSVLRFLLLALAASVIASSLVFPAFARDAQQPPRHIKAVVLRDGYPTQFCDKKTNKASGFAVDVMDAVAQRAGLSVTYVCEENITALLDRLLRNEADVIPSTAVISERGRQVAYTRALDDIPLYLFARADNIAISGLGGGITVGVRQGGASETVLQKVSDIKLKRYPGFSDALVDLLAGRIDGFGSSEATALGLARKAGVEDRIKAVGPPFGIVKRVFVVRKSDAELLALLNNAIEGFVGTPEYRKIYIAWYGRPTHYWTTRRIVIAGGVAMLALVGLMSAWRYLSMMRLNRELIHSMAKQRQAEEALKESERKYRRIFEEVQDVFYQTDADGAIIALSPSVLRFSGYSVGELIGKPVAGLYLFPEDGTKLQEAMRNKGEVSDYEIVIRSKDNRPVHASLNAHFLYDAAGRHAGVEGALRDISRRKRAEHEVRFLAQIIQNLPEAVCSIDLLGITRSWNKGAEKMLGYTAAEIVGKPITTIIPEEIARYELEHCLTILNAEGSFSGYESVRLTKDNRRIPVKITGVAIKDETQAITNYASIIEDITDSKRAEEERLKSHTLESIGLLAGGIAHDFNNLLTIILSNIGLAKTSMRPDEEAYGLLSNAEQICGLANGLSRRLTTFATGGETVKKIMPLSGLLKDSVSASLKGSNVAPEFYLPDDLHAVAIDEGQIKQVVNNLAANAREAMPNGGILTVRGRNLHVKAKDSLPMREGDYLEISICDAGVGIPAESLAKIFDPYFSTKDSFSKKGLGLDLAVCYSVIKNHDGLINVESEAGKGTTFHIYLPAAG